MTIKEELKIFPSDLYLSDMKESLDKKNHKSFNPKDKLVQLISEIEEHIDNLMFHVDQADSDDEM